MRIGCYHEDNSELITPMIDIRHDADGYLVATYGGGHRVLIGAMGNKVPVLSHDIGDEPFVILTDTPLAVETPADVILNAFELWTSSIICAVDPVEQAFSIHQLTKDGLVLRDSEGDTDVLPTSDGDKPLCAVWNGEQLYGFAYGKGTPLARANGTFIGTEIDRVRDRLKMIGTRLRGEWTIVAGEGERLGTNTMSVATGTNVKIGFKPAAPMPDDLHAEWMWVAVTRIRGNSITGTLQNAPEVFAIALEYGDTVQFERRDIFAVEDARQAA